MQHFARELEAWHAARIEPWCGGGRCTDVFSAETVCTGICTPKPADATCHFDASGTCVGAERELAPGELIADYAYRCEPCASRFAEMGTRGQRKNGLRLVGAGFVLGAVFVIMYVTKTDIESEIHSDDPFSLALVIGYAAIVCVAIGLSMIGLRFRPKLRL